MLDVGAGRNAARRLAVALLSLLLAAWIAPFFFEIALVPTASMAGTIFPGDHLLVRHYGAAAGIHRGDIVSFRAPGHRELVFVKRVVALGGDTIEIRSGQVWLNGHPVPEQYKTSARAANFAPFTVPPGRLFVLGDNRDLSEDSRAFGAVPLADVTGRPVLICWSFAVKQWLDQRGDLRLSAYATALAHIRWNRIAKSL